MNDKTPKVPSAMELPTAARPFVSNAVWIKHCLLAEGYTALLDRSLGNFGQETELKNDPKCQYCAPLGQLKLGI
jgi:hypothetical protein